MGACATKPVAKEGEEPLPAEEEAVENKDKEVVAVTVTVTAAAEAESGQQSLSTLLSREIEVGLIS